MTRIFLTSCHFSSILASIITHKISKPGDKNYLLIDNFRKKESMIAWINSTKDVGNWVSVIDGSIRVDDTINLQPSLRKKITRNLKHLPVISTVYNVLLAKYQQKYTSEKTQEFKRLFEQHNLTECDELFLLTQTNLNEPLQKLFPKATVNYYEHGIGDYLYFEKNNFEGTFYGLFGNEFKKYLDKKGSKNNNPIFGDFTANDLETAFGFYAPIMEKQLSSFKNKKAIFFLMDSLETCNMPDNFWTDYLRVGLSHIENREEYILILKPHQNQSQNVIDITKTYLEESNFNYVLLDDPLLVSTAAEIIFMYLKEEIKFVISTYSSTVFYLSKFYPEKCQFILLYDFVGSYMQRAPKQYINHFTEIKPLIEGVFMSSSIKRMH
ncbi:MAG TPA: polysialyltransferase family glycosyltransferase [Bacteroidia bacterium]|nr:polysialyltransferase family glycosyltransferase [Bacteroidia bacterium]